MKELTIISVPTEGGEVCICGPLDLVCRTYNPIRFFNYERAITKHFSTLRFEKFLDVGAAFGFFSHYVKHHYPSVEVVAFEAEPFRQACLSYTTGDFERVFGAVGPVKLKLGEGHHQMRFDEEAEMGIDLADYLNEKPTLIKMDVEGCEKTILESLSEDIRTNLNYSWVIEIHPHRNDLSPETIKNLLPKHKAKKLSGDEEEGIVTYLFSDDD